MIVFYKVPLNLIFNDFTLLFQFYGADIHEHSFEQFEHIPTLFKRIMLQIIIANNVAIMCTHVKINLHSDATLTCSELEIF